MTGILSKTYQEIMDAVDNFANCSSGFKSQTNKKKDEVNADSTSCHIHFQSNHFDAILENKFVLKAFRTIADNHYNNHLEEILYDSLELTPKGFPNLFVNYHDCCRILNFKDSPNVYISSVIPGINAISIEKNNNTIIILSYLTVIGLTDKEQKFILGHELGHVLQGHLLAHTLEGLLQDLNKRAELLGPIISDLIDIPLNQWYRESEFSADRMGYLCCKDIDTIEQLFIKLDNDLPENAISQYIELTNAHPRISERLSNLKQYIENSNHNS